MEPFITSDTLLGVGLQAYGEAHDKPRRPQYVAEYTQGKIRPDLTTYASRSLRRTTARRYKTAAARASFPGSFPFEATPNGALARFFCMLFGEPTTALVGGQTPTLTAAANVGDVTLMVAALAAAIPSGMRLNFTIARTVQTTGGANNIGATTLNVAALPGRVASNTVLRVGGYYFRATAAAAAGATTIPVTALPASFIAGSTVAYDENAAFNTTTVVNAGATSIPIATATAGIGSGATAFTGGKYKHVWTNTKAYCPATLVQYIGNWVRVHPGCVGNTFELNVEKEMENFITPTLAVMGLNQLNKYTLTQSGLDAALMDALDPFSALDAIFVINGVMSPEAREVTLSTNRNLRAKNVLNRLRGATRHFPTITDANMTARFYFSNEDLLETFFGQAQAQTGPYGATKRLPNIAVSLEFATEPAIDGELPYEMNFRFPKAVMETVDEPVGTQGSEIYQEANFIPEFDPVSQTDMIIELVNDETKSDIMTPNAPIAPVPQNKVTSYFAA